MTNQAVIENKISAVKKYLGIVEGYEKYSRREIETNLDIRGAVERYLYLAVQATIDLADAVVAYKHFRKPTSMSETFDILHEEKIIPKELTEKMVKMTGFRNIVAHDYEKINYDIVYVVMRDGMEDIKDFVKNIEKI